MSLANSVPFKFFWRECSNNECLESYKQSWNTEKKITGELVSKITPQRWTIQLEVCLR